MTRIAIIAPSRSITPEIAQQVEALRKSEARWQGLELCFHDQCYAQEGHFAGPDAVRAAAFVEVANDPAYDAVWFARGGYGAGRLLEQIDGKLTAAAHSKRYIGYSDTGFIHALLLTREIGQCVHGPMPADISRQGGEAALARIFEYLSSDQPAGVECQSGRVDKAVAFNLSILRSLIGTPFMPDLAGRTLFLEEVGEYEYAIDRALCQLVSSGALRGLLGVFQGSFEPIPENEIAFGKTVTEIVQEWCAKAGVPYLGLADIGHSIDNKIIPFGHTN